MIQELNLEELLEINGGDTLDKFHWPSAHDLGYAIGHSTGVTILECGLLFGFVSVFVP